MSKQLLLYFGAGWDMTPLNFVKLTNGKKITKQTVNKFVFVDALPKLSHYSPDQIGYTKSNNEKNFIGEIERNITLLGWTIVHKRKDKNIITYTLSRNRRNVKLCYIINTTVEEFINKYPSVLKKVTHLIKKGFNPFAYGLILENLPNLKYW